MLCMYRARLALSSLTPITYTWPNLMSEALKKFDRLNGLHPVPKTPS